VKKSILFTTGTILVLFFMASSAHSWGKFKALNPENGKLIIPVEDVNDGQAHYFRVEAEDGITVNFFVLMSSDGVIRAAVDACDVCFRSGKGYVQEGDFMVCTNCGRRFASDRINEIKGGCNPAPLNRTIIDKNLVISMADINQNSWYCKFK
jgi:uncharacterized membrane protein